MPKGNLNLANNPLANVLKAKSRRRRQILTDLSKVSGPSQHIRNDLLPKLELVELEIAKLTLPNRNTRNIEQSHVMEVASSISTLGFCDPIFVDQDGGVLDGAIRVQAARLLGLNRVPCIRANHLST